MMRAVKSAAAVILTVLTILATSQTPGAQTDAATLLASAKTIRCTFPVSVRTTWKDGVPQPVVRPSGNFVVNIREIKADAGSAVLAVGTGGKDITLVVAEENRYFLDAGGGRVAIAAVLGVFSTGTRLKASHSVSDYTAIDIASFSSQPDIVQYWGDCEVIPSAII